MQSTRSFSPKSSLPELHDSQRGTRGFASHLRLCRHLDAESGQSCLGYQTALHLGGEVLVKMAGDGKMAPENLSLLLDSLIEKGYDYTKGNRFLHSEAINQMPVVRITSNIILTFLTKAASGY